MFVKASGSPIFVAAGNVGRRRQRERRRDAGLELQGKTGFYFHSVRVTRAPLDEGEKEAPPRSSTRKRKGGKEGGPRASRPSMPPVLIPGAVDGRLHTG